MKLEDQVCSLELAKRLKALGVKQESYCYWDLNHKSGAPGIYVCGPPQVSPWEKESSPDKFAAFTVAELGEMLPDDYFTNRIGSEWGAFELVGGNSQLVSVEIGWQKTEADARALMLCHLIEKGLMKL